MYKVIKGEKIMLHVRMSIISGLLAWLLFAGICVAGEPEFTIAVAADGQEKTGQISKVAGRAPYFLIFDKGSNLLEAVANPHADAAGGAGPRTANFLADKHIKVVIAGHFGSKMSNALEAANIKYVEKQGIIIDGVKGVNHAN